MSSPRDNFGKPRDGSKYEIITVPENGSLEGRPLPPYGSNRETGQWARFIKQHYGSAVRDPKDPTKTRQRPLECLEDKDASGLVTKTCPKCEHNKSRQQEQKDAVMLAQTTLTEQGRSKAEIDAEVKKIVASFLSWFKIHNLDMKWFIPWKTIDGRFVLLKIPHKGKKAIEKVRKAWRAKKKPVDCLDIDHGFWLRVTRTGSNLDTEYDCEPVMDTKTIEGVGDIEFPREAPLSDQDLDTIVKVLPDLNSPSMVRHLEPQQIQMIIDSDYAPETVETVLNLGRKVQAPAESDGGEDEPTELPASTPPAKASAPATPPKPTPAPAPEPEASDEDDEAAELERKAAELRAKKAAAKAAAPKPAPAPAKASAPKNSALDPAMSDDEFMARFGPRDSQ